MNFRKTSAILLAISFALVVLVSELAVANDDDKEQQQAQTATPANQEQEVENIMGEIYMGVDANDKEAVNNRIKELNIEKWREMFGSEVDFDGIDFSPDFEGGLLEQAKKKIKTALDWLRDFLKNRRTGTTTPKPFGDDRAWWMNQAH